MVLKKPTLKYALVSDLLKGKGVGAPGGAARVELSNGELIDRACVWGTLTELFESPKEFAVLTLDDGTGCIQCVAFEELSREAKSCVAGENYIAFGGLRERSESIQLVLEGFSKVVDANQVLFHRLKALELKSRSFKPVEKSTEAVLGERKGAGVEDFEDRVIVEESERIE